MRYALLLLLTLGGIVSGQTGSPDIVISQVYGGGGNAGAQLRSDFIELFNRGGRPVAVTGWSVQYASATGTTWQVTPISGTIQPGRYFLVRQADGANAAAAALPEADAVGTIAMSGTAAKVALARSATALSGARPTADVVDLVAYGDTNGFEGSGPGRVLTNTTAAIRRGAGCRDTDDNAADFQTGVPNPRNSASPAVADCSALAVEALPATISQIQGPGSTSPLAGQLVVTRGVITATSTNGLWIQSLPADQDNDPATSEGVFVFLGSAPATSAVRGAVAEVTGTVAEFRPASDLGSPTLTELVEPQIAIQATGQPLPAPVVLASGGDWERYEGMRVSAAEIRTVSGTLGSVNETNAASTSNGVFYGVLPGQPRPYREAEVAERLRVDTRAQGASALNVTTGTMVRNLVGPLDFAFRTYSIVQDRDVAPQVSGGRTFAVVPAAASGEFTIAAANLQRFFDDKDDPSTADPVLTPAAVQLRLLRTSRVIQGVLNSPDVIAVEEVENLDILRQLAAASGDYDAYLFEGNDPGGIDVGLLVKRGRSQVVSVVQEGKDTPLGNDRLWDRPLLIARLNVSGVPLTAIVVHLRSLINAETATVAAKRQAQADELRRIAAERIRGGEQVAILGDFNAFQDDALMDSILRGTTLTNLTDSLPVSENYTYVEDGVAQTLDHVLITPGLRDRLVRYQIARVNADFPDAWRGDPARIERVSDHDFPVATFAVDPSALPFTPASVTNAATFLSGPVAPMEAVTIFTRQSAVGVTFDGEAAGVIAANDAQITVTVPAGVAGRESTEIRLARFGAVSTPVRVGVRAAAPGVFETGGGQGAVLNQDSTVNGASAPAARGSVVQIFGTGATSDVQVRIGGQTAEVQYVGPSPGLPAGIVQVNARVPASVAPGAARLVLSSGDQTSRLTTTVSVR